MTPWELVLTVLVVVQGVALALMLGELRKRNRRIEYLRGRVGEMRFALVAALVGTIFGPVIYKKFFRGQNK
jgi:hypothetical protein